jgi:hypothetical protein
MPIAIPAQTPESEAWTFNKGVTMHTVNLRVESINSRHVKATLFMDGVNNGSLTFDIGEYQLFSTLLLMGSKATNGHVNDTSDYNPFKQWSEDHKDYQRK